ncbi:PREDICTED: spermatogenesis- and oogenesis-specific basic helix-loop-helix-containing protein 2-like [Hipposideros armiger]|uniref:Spermatogenesis- and oogenesis-specific basic helix-loop-helix-containing protein 2-like n=1 Tax=Hipposideros armiger TaxID=186990 RepID=A0A8B7S5V4_HIPAR|nr:PREDICTED: spermatogenesis- and oogenesis-specific basic helix-loop-helix-containing protein 2-like [Hipposideros armiger]
MAASIIGQELGQISGQAKIDLLLVGDVTAQYLADIVQKFFYCMAEVIITISDVRKLATLLDACAFNMVFLKVTLPTVQELEAVNLIRERIKYCCEQLRTLLPYIKGRKNDTASIIEATVEHVKYVRERIPPAVMGQITEALQSNGRFCKKQPVPIQFSLPGTVMAQRENSVLASTYSPVRGIRFLANQCLNMYSVPTLGGSVDDAMRGQSSSTSENAIGDMYKSLVPSTALSLNSFHAVRYYSKVIPSYDAAAVTNQNISVHFPPAVPKVSKFLPQHCNSVLDQTCTIYPNCLQQFWAY